MNHLVSAKYNGVKVFSATMGRTRDALSDRLTQWKARHPDYEIVDTVVTQSSDDAYHCLTITVFYNSPK